MKPAVHILILNWNGRDLTLDCLQSLSRVQYENLYVTVIDNHSTDDSVFAVNTQYPNVPIIQLDRNYGFAGGYNRAIRELTPQPDEFLLLLNNDTTVDPNMVDELLAGVQRYGTGHIYGAKIFYADHPGLIWYAGGNVSLSGFNISHRGIRQKDNDALSQDMKTDYITGCCLLIRAELYQELHGFDERFNMYAEDVDLCLRAKKLNAACYMIHNAHLWHKVSASVGGNLSMKKNARKLKSRLLLIRKHGGKVN